MKIREQIVFWMGLLVMVVLLNALRSVLAINETHDSERRTREDFEVVLNARNLRYLLSTYNSLGVMGEFLPSEENDRQKKEARQALEHQLEMGLGQGTEPFIQTKFEEIKEKAWQLLRWEDAFLDPGYTKLSDGVLKDVEGLVQVALEVVTQERQADERFFRYHMRLSIAILCVSLVLIFLVMLLMRRRLFGPLRELFALLQRIREGDLSVEWHGNKHDEIGELGETVTQMSQEIERRRKERIDFVSSVTHDLKNPISTIGLSSDLALRDPSRMEKPQLLGLFKTIKTQAERMRRLTDDLQEAVKGNRPFRIMQYSRFDLDELARMTLKAFQASYPSHEYALELGKVPLPILADQDRVSQVLTNLLSNAVKYSPEGSLIELWIGEEKGAACIEVKDRGLGISDTEKEQIFEAYLRLESGKKVSEGTGLGLAIVKDIVVSHGGSISVKDRQGGGSVFRIVLPLSAQGASSGETAA